MDKIEKKVEFQSAWSKPQDFPSPAGQEIYNWIYENECGDIVEESTNQFEMTQSYLKQTDYKEAIRKYGIEHYVTNVIGGDSGVYADVSDYNDSYDDLNAKLESLSNQLAEALAKNARSKAKEIEDAGRENPKKDGEIIGEEE